MTEGGRPASAGGDDPAATVDRMADGTPPAVTVDDVQAAAARIAGFVHRTPVMTSRRIDAACGRSLHFKCENLQRVGAFKYRGATNAVQSLSAADAARGVVTHSSGNHAQALALAAGTRGIPATIVMPSNAPAVKQAAVAEYGATIVLCEPTLAARETTTAAVIAETGAALVHPYDDPRVIAGQGTMALELLEDAADLDVVIAPVGGGGMMSGICVAVRGTDPTIRLIGAEPAGADDAARSLASGERIATHVPDTIADGLLTTLGEHTWPILRASLETIVTVDDAAIVRAMRMIMESMKLVVEPSGAVGLAAAMEPAFTAAVPEGARVGIVLCGGNVDLDRLPW
ncbi:MAG: pyridoxal-phosphate dependent enzyme [Phycisphaerales bacterium]